jgi:hypothetical protein
MMTCVLLMAGLLGPAGAIWPAEALRGDKPPEGFVIFFTWQQVERWQVEIREYRFHQGAPPKLLPMPSEAGVIESQYVPDLRSFFEKVRKQDRSDAKPSGLRM